MKTLVTLIVISVLSFGTYYYFKPNQVKDWFRDAGLITAPETTRVYKWQDGEGNWHVSDKPPPGDATYEVRDYRSDENVLPLPPQLENDD